MKPYEYHEPTRIEEACELLHSLGDKARILAGGTDLVIKMKRRVITPDHVVNIKNIPGLNDIRQTEDGFEIGAAVPLSAVVAHPGLRKKIPMLCEAAGAIGSVQVRNLATLGGNLCNAAPSADMAPGLLVLDATATLAGREGRRTIPLSSFFSGPGAVSLQRGEMLAQVTVPIPSAGTRSIYIKHGPRQAMDCAVVGVAVGLALEGEALLCRDAKIALGAVAPTPVRAVNTEKLLIGKPAAEFPLDAVKENIGEEVAPISDVRGSAAYRTAMVSTLAVRAIEGLIAECRGSQS